MQLRSNQKPKVQYWQLPLGNFHFVAWEFTSKPRRQHCFHLRRSTTHSCGFKANGAPPPTNMASNEKLDHERHRGDSKISSCSDRSAPIDPDQLTRLMSRLSIGADADDNTSIIDTIDSLSIEADNTQAVSRDGSQSESSFADSTPLYIDILSILKSIIQEHTDVSAKEIIQTVNAISTQMATGDSHYTTCDFNKCLRANLKRKTSLVRAGCDEADISVTNDNISSRAIREHTETRPTTGCWHRDKRTESLDEDTGHDNFEASLPSIYANTPLQQDTSIDELLDLASSMDDSGNGVVFVDKGDSSRRLPVQIAPRPPSVARQAANTTSPDSQLKSLGKTANRPSSYHKEEFIVVSKRELLAIDKEVLTRAFENDAELYAEVLKEPPTEVNSEETPQGYSGDEKSPGRGPMTCNLCGKALKDHICLFARVPRPILELLRIHLSKPYQDILDSYNQVDLAKILRAGGDTDVGDCSNDNSVSNRGKFKMELRGYLTC